MRRSVSALNLPLVLGVVFMADACRDPSDQTILRLEEIAAIEVPDSIPLGGGIQLSDTEAVVWTADRTPRLYSVSPSKVERRAHLREELVGAAAGPLGQARFFSALAPYLLLGESVDPVPKPHAQRIGDVRVLQTVVGGGKFTYYIWKADRPEERREVTFGPSGDSRVAAALTAALARRRDTFALGDSGAVFVASLRGTFEVTEIDPTDGVTSRWTPKLPLDVEREVTADTVRWVALGVAHWDDVRVLALADLKSDRRLMLLGRAGRTIATQTFNEPVGLLAPTAVGGVLLGTRQFDRPEVVWWRALGASR